MLISDLLAELRKRPKGVCRLTAVAAGLLAMDLGWVEAAEPGGIPQTTARRALYDDLQVPRTSTAEFEQSYVEPVQPGKPAQRAYGLTPVTITPRPLGDAAPADAARQPSREGARRALAAAEAERERVVRKLGDETQARRAVRQLGDADLRQSPSRAVRRLADREATSELPVDADLAGDSWLAIERPSVEAANRQQQLFRLLGIHRQAPATRPAIELVEPVEPAKSTDSPELVAEREASLDAPAELVVSQPRPDRLAGPAPRATARPARGIPWSAERAEQPADDAANLVERLSLVPLPVPAAGPSVQPPRAVETSETSLVAERVEPAEPVELAEQRVRDIRPSLAEQLKLVPAPSRAAQEALAAVDPSQGQPQGQRPEGTQEPSSEVAERPQPPAFPRLTLAPAAPRRPELAAIEPEAAAAQPELAAIEPEAAAAQPELAAIEPELAVSESAATDAKRPERQGELAKPRAVREPVSQVGYPASPVERTDVDGRMRLEVRQSQPLPVDFRVARIDVSDRDVCEVLHFGTFEMTVIGKRAGTTLVTLWDQDQTTRRVYQVQVGVPDTERLRQQEQLTRLRSLLAELFPDCQLELLEQPGTLAVRGEARSEQQAREILSIVRRSVLLPVVDQVEVR